MKIKKTGTTRRDLLAYRQGEEEGGRKLEEDKDHVSHLQPFQETYFG